jgi:hypothetical protein
MDLLLAASFASFAAVSFTLDAALAVGIPMDGSSTNVLARLSTQVYVRGTDTLLVQDPPFIHVMAAVNAFVFGPFYIVLVHALWARRSWVRLPALMYATAMTYNMIIVLGVHVVGGYQHDDLPKFLAFNLPFLAIPLALAWRMRRADPFDARPMRRAGGD